MNKRLLFPHESLLRPRTLLRTHAQSPTWMGSAGTLALHARPEMGAQNGARKRSPAALSNVSVAKRPRAGKPIHKHTLPSPGKHAGGGAPLPTRRGGLELFMAPGSITGYRCVTLSSSNASRPYEVRVSLEGRKRHIGSFATAEEAAFCFASWKRDGLPGKPRPEQPGEREAGRPRALMTPNPKAQPSTTGATPGAGASREASSQPAATRRPATPRPATPRPATPRAPGEEKAGSARGAPGAVPLAMRTTAAVKTDAPKQGATTSPSRRCARSRGSEAG